MNSIKNIKLLPIFCVGSFLAGCSTIEVVKYYDEFTKKDVCQLDLYKIQHEANITKFRTTFLDLVKVDNDWVLAKISSIIHPRYPFYRENPEINLMILDYEGKLESLKTEGFETEKHYKNLGASSHWVSSFRFKIKKNHLGKISSSKQTELNVKIDDSPLNINFDDKDKRALKTFLEKCY